MIAVGTAVYTRHDARTRHTLDGLRQRLEHDTDRELLAAASVLVRPSNHPLAPVVRNRLEHEVEWRWISDPRFGDWWTASLATLPEVKW